jgi:hypothetical protein
MFSLTMRHIPSPILAARSLACWPQKRLTYDILGVTAFQSGAIVNGADCCRKTNARSFLAQAACVLPNMRSA